MASIYVSFLNFMSSILEMRNFTHFLCNCVHLYTNPKNNSQLRLRGVINQFCTNMENVADIADMSVNWWGRVENYGREHNFGKWKQ